MKIKNSLFVLILLAVTPMVNAQPSLAWAKSAGGIDGDQGRFLAVDAEGSLYTTGFFHGTVDFDPGVGIYNLTSAGMADVFVSKLDSSGNLMWAVRLGGDSYDAAYAIAVDTMGYVYVTGRFNDTADFDPGPGVLNLLASGYDCFVIKLDASTGNLSWVKQFITSFIVDPHSITVDAAGNVITSGRFAGQADFDPGAGMLIFSSQGFFEDAFISKLDASGNLLWARQLASPPNGYSYALSVAVDEIGNVYTTGGFSDTIDFDPGPNVFNLVGEYFGDAFIYKLDKRGDFVWAKQLTGNGNDDGWSIALDAFSNVYTTGTFNATVDFDPGAGIFNMTSAALGNFDVYISKLDTSGNFVWAKQLTSTVGSMIFPYSMTLDSAASVYTIGVLLDSADFDPGPGTHYLASTSQSDIFISKLDSSGNFSWAIQMGSSGSGFSSGNSIGLDREGNIYAAGIFQYTVDFDPGAGVFPLTAVALDDVFMIKLRGGINENPTAVGGNIMSNNLVLYPNPTSGVISIRSDKKFSNVVLSVRSAIGQEVFNKTYSSTDFISFTLDTAPGLYFIELLDADTRTGFKVMKQ